MEPIPSNSDSNYAGINSQPDVMIRAIDKNNPDDVKVVAIKTTIADNDNNNNIRDMEIINQEVDEVEPFSNVMSGYDKDELAYYGDVTNLGRSIGVKEMYGNYDEDDDEDNGDGDGDEEDEDEDWEGEDTSDVECPKEKGYSFTLGSSTPYPSKIGFNRGIVAIFFASLIIFLLKGKFQMIDIFFVLIFATFLYIIMNSMTGNNIAGSLPFATYPIPPHLGLGGVNLQNRFPYENQL